MAVSPGIRQTNTGPSAFEVQLADRYLSRIRERSRFLRSESWSHGFRNRPGASSPEKNICRHDHWSPPTRTETFAGRHRFFRELQLEFRNRLRTRYRRGPTSRAQQV